MIARIGYPHNPRLWLLQPEILNEHLENGADANDTTYFKLHQKIQLTFSGLLQTQSNLIYFLLGSMKCKLLNYYSFCYSYDSRSNPLKACDRLTNVQVAQNYCLQFPYRVITVKFRKLRDYWKTQTSRSFVFVNNN